MSNGAEAQGRTPETESSSELASFAEVRESELRRIAVRRRVVEEQLGASPNDAANGSSAGEPPANKKSCPNLVGVALSGGGIRSGAFSLGFLMGLCRSGLLRFVDYVSTVSGGGYAAAAMSAEAIKRHRQQQSNGDSSPSDEFLFKDPDGSALIKPRAAANSARPYPRAMLELVREGSRWLRDRTAFESLNRFFIGGLATMVFSLCWLVAVCSLLAWLFRWLDSRRVRDWLEALGMTGDTGTAITPSFVLFGVWLACWLVSLADHKRRATGRLARRVFWLWVVATVLAFVLIATSGEVDVNYWSDSFGWSDEDVELWKTRLSWVFPVIGGAILASLLPYFRVSALLRSGRVEAGAKEKWIFGAARLGLLWGVPLLLFAFFAHENISGWDQRRDRRLGSSDLENTSHINKWIDKLSSEYQQDRSVSQPVASRTQDFLVDEPKLLEALPGTYLLTGAVTFRSGDDRLKPEVPKIVLLQQLQRFSRNQSRLSLVRSHDERLKADQSWGDEGNDLRFPARWAMGATSLIDDTRISRAAAANLTQRMWSREMLYALNQRLLAPDFYKTIDNNLPRLQQLYPELGAPAAEKQLQQRIAEAKRTEQAVQAIIPLPDAQRDSREKHLSDMLRTVPDDVTLLTAERNPDALGTAVLSRLDHIHDLPAVQHDLRVPKDPANAAQEPLVRNEAGDSVRELQLQFANRAVLQANRNLLEALYPDDVRPFGKKVYASHVLLKDQQYRLEVFFWSALIGLIAAFVADLNTLSWHGYYAERLASYWVGTGMGSGKQYRQKPQPIPLRDLSTVQQGRPYHLINACTISFARDSNDLEHIHGLPVGPFLLSEQYLGSTSLTSDRPQSGKNVDTPESRPAFGPTSDWRHADLTLSDAIALSGAAVSPWATPNHLTRAILFVLNLRTGLWLANPLHRLVRADSLLRRLLHRSSFFPPARFLWSWFTQRNPAEWSHISVNDGGFYENLGLEPLLRRRCKLIFAVDATQDAEYDFDSLSRVIRRCRMQYGIEFLDAETKTPLSLPKDLVPKKPDEESDDDWKLSSKQFTVIAIDYRGMNEVTADESTGSGLASESAEVNPSGEPNQALLILVKANLVDALPIDILQHARRNKEFPNDPTTDQFYDSDKFESYRQLGDTAAGKIVEAIFSHQEDEDELQIADSAEFVDKVTEAFQPSVNDSETTSRSGQNAVNLIERYCKAIHDKDTKEIASIEKEIPTLLLVDLLPAIGTAMREELFMRDESLDTAVVARVITQANRAFARLTRIRRPERKKFLSELRKHFAMSDWEALLQEWLKGEALDASTRKSVKKLLKEYASCEFGEQTHDRESSEAGK